MKPLRATVFKNGGSQAVRLPREFRFAEGESEVQVTRVGRRVILEPLDGWPKNFLKLLGSLAEINDPIERPADAPAGKLRPPLG